MTTLARKAPLRAGVLRKAGHEKRKWVRLRPLTQEQQRRASDPDFIDLTRRWAFYFANLWEVDEDEALSEAFLTLIRTIAWYDFDRDDYDRMAYKTYLKVSIKRQVRMLIWSRSHRPGLWLDADGGSDLAVTQPAEVEPDAESSPAPSFENLPTSCLARLYRAIEVNNTGIVERTARAIDVPLGDAERLITEGRERLARFRSAHPEFDGKAFIIHPGVLGRMGG